ncbi:hypothetical protein OG963_14870 [Streptomyces sp. NBC_01707]|uniref:hypothetical protein n=1 Tax=Streptomyces sp. NBC_01707 TaxID=2975914 RepID=UPI00352DAE12
MNQTDTASTSEQAVEPLPPYSGEEAVCVKCANPEAYTRYRPACSRGMEEHNGRLRRGPLPERLERCCQRCDYTWDEALQPAPGVRPATLAELAWALGQAHRPYALDLSPGCAEHMAHRLLEMTHVLVRADHPAWQPTKPLLVPPAQVPEPDAHLTSGVAIVPHEQPLIPAEQPLPLVHTAPPAPAGRTGFAAPGVAS